MESKVRKNWVDHIKLFACVLVVLGHFFQSMVECGLMNKSYIYVWFIKTIYYFHVPLFFICSGYLYQKYSCVSNVKSWSQNVLKKLVALGIPYVTFSGVTYFLKVIFSGSVNNVVSYGLFETLINKPLSPYWYLYALFFLFVCCPTINAKKNVKWFIFVFLGLKVLSMFGLFDGLEISFVGYIARQGVWFVIGMMISYCDVDVQRIQDKFIYLLLVVFFVTSFVARNVDSDILAFLFGIFACYIFLNLAWNNKFGNTVSKIVTCTMSIYLMHTIFAASLRSVLFTINVDKLWIHIVLGIAISFIGPIVADTIMKRVWKLDFFINPLKYLKIQDK